MEFKKISCTGCLKAIPGKEFLKCSFCSNSYDLECANVTQRSYNSMRQSLKDTWKCQACRSKERKVDNTNTPVRSATQNEGSIPEDVSNVTKRKQASTTVRVSDESDEECHQSSEKLRSIIRSEIKKAIADSMGPIVREQFQYINETLGGFQSSLTSINAQLENLKSSLAEKTNTINSLQKENGHLRESMERLEDHLRQTEQQVLANDVDIVGVPEAKGETVVHVVLSLARKLGVTMSENEIVSADRVGAARDDATGRLRSRPIAVRLVRRAVRDDLLRAARVRRGVTTADAGLTGESRRFYVNERLTRENRQLFLRAREIGQRLHWRFVWSKDGRVYARQHQNEDSPRHRLRSEADLVRVFGASAVGSSDKNTVL